MKETLYTIPLSEVLETMQGCPLCGLADMLENRCVEYITGAAMMEPDVREQVNREGFCRQHYNQTLTVGKRLPVALMLQSRLAYVAEEMTGKKHSRKAVDTPGCYVCGSVHHSMEAMASNLLAVWAKEPAFRQLFASQSHLCFPHWEMLKKKAEKEMPRRFRAEFLQACSQLAQKELLLHIEKIDAFCRSYDYRNAGSETSQPVDAKAAEKAIAWLCGDKKGE